MRGFKKATPISTIIRNQAHQKHREEMSERKAKQAAEIQAKLEKIVSMKYKVIGDTPKEERTTMANGKV